jgi:hypothetical protein
MAFMRFINPESGQQGNRLGIAARPTPEAFRQLSKGHACHAPRVESHNSAWMMRGGDDKHPGGADGLGLPGVIDQPMGLL